MSALLTGNYDTDITYLAAKLRVSENFDVIQRTIRVTGGNASFFFVDGLVKDELMSRLITHFYSVPNLGNGAPDAAAQYLLDHVPAVEANIEKETEKILSNVLSGCIAFLAEGFGASAILIDARAYPARQTQEPESDRVMRGSRDGFVETLLFNTALIRRRIRDPRLTMSFYSIGSESKTDVVLCYLDGEADPEYVISLKKNLARIRPKSLTMGHQSIAECLIKRRWYNPFPKVRMTERPDTAAAQILEGSVVLLCDNSPEAILLPTSFLDFLQEADDFYFPPLTGTYLRLLRHAVFWSTLFITPLWLLLLRNADKLPEGLSFLIPKAPGSIPLLIQLFLVEFAIDGLKLASMNTPSRLSNSFAVVGGLLLGDYAIKVGWLCADVILYMSYVAIAGFTQSSYELGYALKFLRLILLLLTHFFGIWGFGGGLVLTAVLILSNKTLNGKRTYLYPLIPWNAKAMAHLFFRLPKKD